MSLADNALYWIVIVASVVAGFMGFPLWTIAVLGVAAMIVFFIVKPQIAVMGWRERGLSYILFMAAVSSIPAAAFFGIGRLLGAVIR